MNLNYPAAPAFNRQSCAAFACGQDVPADYDIAIVGSGFAGSLLAMIARRQGRSVILLEKGRHPRFAIGESSTPLSNLLLEDLALRYDLPGIVPLTKWGTWQQAYPNLDCGLKRGFTFYHHQFGQHAGASPGREDQLLVAASPHDGIADTHWYRADVDEHFLREAENIGVEYLDEIELTEAVERDDEVFLHGKRRGSTIAISARFVVDATGPRGFLHHAFGLSELPLPDMPPTQALYTHFRDVRRLEDLHRGRGPALSGRRRSGSSRFRWRLDLGSALSQRNYKRGSRSGGFAG